MNKYGSSNTDRRKPNTDHDTLIEVVQILNNHVNNFDAHAQVDKESFKEIGDKLDNHSKYIYIGIGIMGVIQVIIGFHK